jgi:Bacterial protein of unknown function (DUF916)
VIGRGRSRRTLAATRLAATRLAATRLAAACALSFVALVGRAWPAAGASQGPTFSVGPANPDPNDPLSRSYFRPELAPGSSTTETVDVSNTGDAPVDLLVYPVDGLTGTTSGTVYANRADPRQKAGTWLTASVSSLTVPPHQVQTVPFRIDVPPTATPGDHVAGIAFENAHPTRASGFSVTEVIREVIGVQVRVPGPGQFQLHIDSLGFAVPPAVPVASVIVRLGNSGNRLGQPLILVTLHGPNNYVKSVKRQLDTVLPGDTISYPLAWPTALPAGAYTITVIGGGTPPVVLTGTGTLSTPQAGLPHTAPPATVGNSGNPAPGTGSAPGTSHQAKHSSSSWLIVLIIAILAVAALVAGFLVIRRRRRPDEDDGEEGPPPPDAPGGWQKSAVGESRRVQDTSRR